MKIKELWANQYYRKTICVLLLIVTILVSFFGASRFATSPETYRSVIESIDEKKATVMGITATAATVSTLLASIPGDVTTPIAEQIMEISSYLLIVACVLVLEKSLITVIGYLSFNLLIPIACILLGVHLFLNKKILKVLALKLIAFALIIVTIIPLSLKVSDLIYEANKATVEQVTTEVDENMAEEDKGWLQTALDKIKNGISEAGEKAKKILNSFIDAIAIFIISYCAIPILMVFAMFGLLKLIFGIKVHVPKQLQPKFLKQSENTDNKDESIELLEVE